MFDRRDMSYNKNGIYSLEMRINGSLMCAMEMDRMDFEDSKKIKELIDYRNYRNQKQTFKAIRSSDGRGYFYRLLQCRFFHLKKADPIKSNSKSATGPRIRPIFPFADGSAPQKMSEQKPNHFPTSTTDMPLSKAVFTFQKHFSPLYTPV